MEITAKPKPTLLHAVTAHAKISKHITYFRKVYVNVWNLKLEILTCFETVLCHLHGVTFKNIINIAFRILRMFLNVTP